MNTETLTVTGFLLARIAEDEAAARAATSGPWAADGQEVERLSPLGVYLLVVAQGKDNMGDPDGGTRTPSDAEHIARHDPKRVLAGCERDRRILAEHPAPPYIGTPGARLACDRCSDLGGPYGGDDDNDWVDWPCPTLRALALPYADHPDYRDEWRP